MQSGSGKAETTEAPEWVDYGDWIECWNCGGEGEIEDEDWQFAGEFYTCDICDGRGGWKREPGPHSAAMDDDPGM